MLPEHNKGGQLSDLFSLPTLTWAPECLTPSKQPVCVVSGCGCTPNAKDYMERIVEDLTHKTTLYYTKYRCTGMSRRCFMTTGAEYLSSSKQIAIAFPYILTQRSGLSTEVVEIIHGSITSNRGFEAATDNIKRRRQNRFYSLLCEYSSRAKQMQLRDAEFDISLPLTVEQYTTRHQVVDAQVAKRVWMAHTEVYAKLAAAVMSGVECLKVMRLDHSQKFCKKMKVFGADGINEQSSSIRMLLLVQNQIGQIVGRALIRSENHAETEALLMSLRGHVCDSDEPQFLVCDNAYTNRSLVQRVLGEAVQIKQDPFHVIQRLTNKVKQPKKSKWLAGPLSSAMYDLQRNLRPPTEMEAGVLKAIDGIPPSCLGVAVSEWEGCVRSNVNQIRIGDLHVKRNQYHEAG